MAMTAEQKEFQEAMWELFKHPSWSLLRTYIKDQDYASLQLCDDPNTCLKVNAYMSARKSLFDFVEQVANYEEKPDEDTPAE